MTIQHLFPTQAQQPNKFETLWRSWPRKEKKPLARAKYAAILVGLRTKTLDRDSGTFVEIELHATEDEIISGAKAYINDHIDKNTYKLKDGGKFIPYLCHWLNQGGWES